MKNVLFASTALVAFAGAASAEITLTGNAEMGIFNNDALVGDDVAVEVNVVDGETSFHTDLDITFTMSGETDGGLTFGATIDLDESGNGENFEFPGRQGGETIFLSGAFGTLTAGDTDGAVDWALTEVAFNSGSLGDDETVHAGFNGNNGLDGLWDGQVVRYDYSFGDFGVALSAELAEDRIANSSDVLGIGFRYNLDLSGTTVGLGLGYQGSEIAGTDVSALGMSANASFGNGFAAGLSYMKYENHIPNAIADGAFTAAAIAAVPLAANTGGRILTPGNDVDHIGVGVGYTTGAISASLNYGEYDFDAAGVDDIKGYGLTVGYDLGGGAIVQFGYGHSDYGNLVDSADDTVDTVSFGVRMNF
ncbi:outer membrane protein OmpU [Jannaschia faecimaris]|uniref:Outer membrane protein OmpU n=1 Tax=Jannaschia faecimaris TaxID=1244108 RepID=A0A1H3IUT6_9RHOB|nr:porin [Jannaschia faecimaris]SDY31307.1 outer membrane protein OmpU [Jannaschia faecimaris]